MSSRQVPHAALSLAIRLRFPSPRASGESAVRDGSWQSVAVCANASHLAADRIGWPNWHTCGKAPSRERFLRHSKKSSLTCVPSAAK